MTEGGMMSSPSYVYAIGKVVYRFPTRSLELELLKGQVVDLKKRQEDLHVTKLSIGH